MTVIPFALASMIFFPEKGHAETPRRYGFDYEDARFEAADGARLHGWYLKAPREKAAILFFHGNAGNISHRLFKIGGWLERGFSVFLVDYRGYGESEGKIEKQEDVVTDARAALDWLRGVKKIEPARLVLYGESLGTHPALALANESGAAAVILEAPFTSFVDLGRLHYSFVPSMMIKAFEFPNERLAPGVKAPVFILHGTADEICPHAMAERILDLLPGPKEIFSVPGGTHNDLPAAAGPDFWARPERFLQKQANL